jgi:Family of unknown function (DUF5990)
MGTGQSGKRQIHLRLIHNGVQPGRPLDEPLRFGLQDGNGEVHPGLGQPGEPQKFDIVLEVGEGDEASQPVFRGMFAHGPPKGRFVYLSWKRQGKHEHPWAWRIKVPLSDIGWAEVRAAEKPGKCLAANVIGRLPHTSEAIEWQIEALQIS